MARIQGFTLIELVVVIILLGMLTATVLPRFMDSRREAERSVVEANAGAVRSGMQLAHATWRVRNRPRTITMDGGSVVTMDSTSGFPVDNASGAATRTASNMNAASCMRAFRAVMAGQPTVTATNPPTSAFDFYARRANAPGGNPDTCIYYRVTPGVIAAPPGNAFVNTLDYVAYNPGTGLVSFNAP